VAGSEVAADAEAEREQHDDADELDHGYTTLTTVP
jgi:hypothetical protein